MNRRSFLTSAALAGPALLVGSKGSPGITAEIRTLGPGEVSRRGLRAYEDLDGIVVFEFTHYAGMASSTVGAAPVAVGDRLYFDGRPWGSPVIEGRVIRVENDRLMPMIEYVTVRAEKAVA